MTTTFREVNRELLQPGALLLLGLYITYLLMFG